jgi:hypothetical protein
LSLLIAADHLRRRFARFKLCAHLLDLRCLLFHSCGESFDFILLLGASCLPALPRLRRKVSKAIKERSARNSESEVNSDRSVSLGRQGRLDYVNFGTYVPRI